MKILIDALAVENEKTGVTQYALRLLRELLPFDPSVEFVVLVRPTLEQGHELFKIVAENANATCVSKDIPPIGIRRDLRFLRLRHLLGCDLYHCLNSNFPLSMGARSIVTIHDLKYVIFPHYLGKLRWIKSLYLRLVFGHAARRAGAIIAVSDSTRSDLLRLFGRTDSTLERRVVTIHEASCMDPGEPGERHGTDEMRVTYFLSVGELRPHKNVDGLIEGFQRFIRRPGVSEDVRLVIAGKPHRTFEPPAGIPDSIEFLGYVADDALSSLYRNALAFCLVSSYEGFGLPILEAMELGTPVITSNQSSTKEIAGDAALVVDPRDPGEIADAMHQVYSDAELRRNLVERGRARAAQFNWETAAAQTLNLYREIMRKL